MKKSCGSINILVGMLSKYYHHCLELSLKARYRVCYVPTVITSSTLITRIETEPMGLEMLNP